MDFPSDGITLRGIRHFLASASGGGETEGAGQGAGALLQRTTEDVCRDPLLGLTSSPPTSYCSLLRQQGSPDVGAATVFVSHAWLYRLGVVVRALECWEEARLREGLPPSFFWLDLFTNSQHKTVEKPLAWWQSVFAVNVGRIGHTLLILQWADPIPLRRAWCIFELGATLRQGARLEVAMPPDEAAAFLGALNAQSYTEVARALTSVHVASAEASKPEDARAILDTVAAWANGAEGVDAAVSGAMRAWMLGTAQEALARLPQSERGASDLLYESSRLAMRLGRLEEAEALGRASLEGRAAAFGCASAPAWGAMSSLGDVLLARGKLEEAGALFEAVSGAQPDALHALVFLARVRLLQGRLDCAQALLAQAEARNPGGRDVRSALQARESAAALALARGAAADAAAQLASVHEGNVELLGATYPATLGVRCCLAAALSCAGQFAAAEAHFAAVLADQARVLGADHRDTLETRDRYSEHRVRAAGGAASPPPVL